MRELQQVRKLLETHEYSTALSLTEKLLGAYPNTRELEYMRAVALRYLNRISEAIFALELLAKRHPEFSRLYQEKGHCYVAMRDAPRAIEAYRQAIQRNPSLPAAWSRLATLYRMTGDAENARISQQHVEITSKLAPEVLSASGLLSDGDVEDAERIIRPYLLQHPQDVEAMRILAKIALEYDALQDAHVLLSSVIELAPDYDAARCDYARTLLRRHQHAESLTQLEILLQKNPENRTYRTIYATALVGIGNHEKALLLYRNLLVGAPRAPDILLSIAHTLKTLGRQEEAIEAYREAAGSRPHFGDAYWSLANLKTYRFTTEELVSMQASEANPEIKTDDRLHMCFALGKGLEDVGNYERAFEYYERGNALKKADSPYRAELVEKNTTDQKETCDEIFFASRSGWGCQDRDPIFIVGLPRAGSTLLEQILASHSMVEGTMELADVGTIVVELEGHTNSNAHHAYPKLLETLTAEDFARLGEKYIRDTRIYRTNKPFFIDKMPNNFRHIGLIHLMFPNAKIIDARRESMACCFSNFKQLFATGQEFTYSMEDIARYYRTYVELMDHWDTVLPKRILRVQHEDVVDNLEGNVRRILDYCELPFEAACVEFYKTQRSVRTASSEQVRQPIFRDSLDQWRHFAAWLEPLKVALGDLAS